MSQPDKQPVKRWYTGVALVLALVLSALSYKAARCGGPVYEAEDYAGVVVGEDLKDSLRDAGVEVVE
jgi:hypothetical protein